MPLPHTAVADVEGPHDERRLRGQVPHHRVIRVIFTTSPGVAQLKKRGVYTW